MQSNKLLFHCCHEELTGFYMYINKMFNINILLHQQLFSFTTAQKATNLMQYVKGQTESRNGLTTDLLA